jgi:membrane-bound metal-dependent hydrolase YbcI (DUF457 family)
MPSPVAHGIVGLSLGLAWLAPPSSSLRLLVGALARRWRGLLVLLAIACAPDVDYFFGLFYGDFNLLHQIYSHTIAWITAVALVAWLFWRRVEPETPTRLFVFLWLVAASHLLLDYLTDDGSYPYGIMVVWPLTADYFTSPVHLFPRMMKHSWREVFQSHNLAVALQEAIFTLPLLAGVTAWKLWKGGRFANRPPESAHAAPS